MASAQSRQNEQGNPDGILICKGQSQAGDAHGPISVLSSRLNLFRRLQPQAEHGANGIVPRSPILALLNLDREMRTKMGKSKIESRVRLAVRLALVTLMR